MKTSASALALTDTADPENLSRVANNREISREKRATAIFRLFEMYLKPGDNSKRFRSIFKDSKWISESKIHRLTFINGYIPIELGESTYRMDLFPDKDGHTRWFIFFSLTGTERGYVYGKELESAIDYLEGRDNSETVRMVDFALCECRGDNLFPHITHPSKNK